MRWVIYTCIADNYDTLLPILGHQAATAFYVVSPERPRIEWNWNWLPIPFPEGVTSAAAYNRYFKFHPQKLFHDACGSVYVDGNMLIKRSLDALIDEFMTAQKSIGLFRHNERTKLDDELSVCLEKAKISKSNYEKIIQLIREHGFQNYYETSILTENGVILRLHCEEAYSVGRTVWEYYQLGISRDQIILPLILARDNVKIHTWDWNFRSENSPFLVPTGHRESQNYLMDLIFVARVIRSRYKLGEISLPDIRDWLKI